MEAPVDVVHELYRSAFMQSKADEERQQKEEELKKKKNKYGKNQNTNATPPSINSIDIEELSDMIEEGG